MRYVPEFLSEAEEAELLVWINGQPWNADMSRRVQPYGYRYDFRRREIPPRRIGPLPEPIGRIGARLYDEGLIRALPDQALVNEYEPGQGIAAHVDCNPAFGDDVVTISLLDHIVMRFAPVEGGAAFDQWLERRSACVLSGPSRYEWTHEIAKRFFDPTPGGRRRRGKRLSLTFRKASSLRRG